MASERSSLTALLSGSFGFDPTETARHFVVTIGRGAQQPVEISEHYEWSESTGSAPVTVGDTAASLLRVRLARPKWDAIADELRVELNLRLRRHGRSAGRWKIGRNLVRRDLGKELTLLAWAIEDADPGIIPTALANWKGLVPEERWWLYTQTAAATGGVNDRNRGWRKAVRFALTDNPIGSQRASDESIVPEFFRIAREKSEAPLFESLAADEGEEQEHAA